MSSPYRKLYKLIKKEFPTGKNIPISEIVTIIFYYPGELFGSGFDVDAIVKDMETLSLVKNEKGMINLLPSRGNT